MAFRLCVQVLANRVAVCLPKPKKKGGVLWREVGVEERLRCIGCGPDSCARGDVDVLGHRFISQRNHHKHPSFHVYKSLNMSSKHNADTHIRPSNHAQCRQVRPLQP